MLPWPSAGLATGRVCGLTMPKMKCLEGDLSIWQMFGDSWLSFISFPGFTEWLASFLRSSLASADFNHTVQVIVLKVGSPRCFQVMFPTVFSTFFGQAIFFWASLMCRRRCLFLWTTCTHGVQQRPCQRRRCLQLPG